MLFAGLRKRSRRGFTLLETMVAVLLLVFATAIFGAAYPITTQILLSGRNCDLASDACQRQLEFWRNVGYASLPPIPAGQSRLTRTFMPPSALPVATGTVTFIRMDPTWTETTVEGDRVRVEAVVTWGTSGIRGGRVSMTTLLLR